MDANGRRTKVTYLAKGGKRRSKERTMISDNSLRRGPGLAPRGAISARRSRGRLVALAGSRLQARCSPRPPHYFPVAHCSVEGAVESRFPRVNSVCRRFCAPTPTISYCEAGKNPSPKVLPGMDLRLGSPTHHARQIREAVRKRSPHAARNTSLAAPRSIRTSLTQFAKTDSAVAGTQHVSI